VEIVIKMRCPKCRKGSLDENDGSLICWRCGACFNLEYIGYYEEGSNTLIGEGFEKSKWFEEYEIKK